MDMLHKLLRWVDHDRYKAAGLVLALLITAVLVGCPIKTASVLQPGKEVSALGLKQEAAVIQAEYDGKLKLVELGVEDLASQQATREQFVGVLAGAAQGAAAGTMTPLAAVNIGVTLLSLLGGVGAVLDKRRGDKVIANLKEPPAEPSEIV